MIRLFKRKPDEVERLCREQEQELKDRNQFIQVKAQEIFNQWMAYMDAEEVTQANITRLSHMAVFAAKEILDRVEENRA